MEGSGSRVVCHDEKGMLI